MDFTKAKKGLYSEDIVEEKFMGDWIAHLL
jgi:hypothetical protein